MFDVDGFVIVIGRSTINGKFCHVKILYNVLSTKTY